MSKIKIVYRKKTKQAEQRRDVIDLAPIDALDEAEPEHRVTLSELLDQRRADAEAEQTQQQRSDYLEKLEAYLRRPITAAELERPRLGDLFTRRNSQ